MQDTGYSEIDSTEEDLSHDQPHEPLTTNLQN